MATYQYQDLINYNNTIYNKQTQAGYAKPEDLATDLGLSVLPANWQDNPNIQKVTALPWGTNAASTTAAPVAGTSTTAPIQEGTTRTNPTTGVQEFSNVEGGWSPVTSPGNTQASGTPTYIRQAGTTDVYNIGGSTPKYVSFEEANAGNIWGQVQEVQNASQYGVQATNLNSLVGPGTTSIGDTGLITAESPALPSGGDINNYLTNASADLQAARTTLESSYDKQIKALQDQQDSLQRQMDAYKTEEETTLSKIGALSTPWQKAYEDSERQRLLIEKNYFDNQSSIKELEDLMNKAVSDIQYEQAITGLSSIRNPRIAKTKEDYAARVGVIEAVMAARNNQIAVATNLVDRGINAIANDKKAQIDYYNGLIKFYDGLRTEKGDRLITLEAQELNYVNAKIGLLENDLTKLQASSDYIKNLMIDPATAGAMEKAGVKLTDSIETINSKLAKYSYTKEVQDRANTMAENGYSQLLASEVAGKSPGTVITTVDSNGNKAYWYKAGDYKQQVVGSAETGYSLVTFDNAGNIINKVSVGGGTSTSGSTIISTGDKMYDLATVQGVKDLAAASGWTYADIRLQMDRLFPNDISDTTKVNLLNQAGLFAPKDDATSLTREHVASLYGITDNSEKTGFLGLWGKTNAEKLDEIMTSIKSYQDAGYADEKILTMLQK